MEQDSEITDLTAIPVSTTATGAQGEDDAAQFLTRRGYRIIDSNVRPFRGAKRGEIDLVAWCGEYLVFIEVKTRRAALRAAVAPAEAVDWRKRRQLVLLAQCYLTRYNLDGVACRFDVVEVIRRNDVPEFNLIVNAFDGNDI